MEVRTHRGIDRRWSGEPVHLAPGEADVALETLPEMAADEHGLAHGGFLFSLADYSAMLAVNDPLVVLAQAQVRFLRPVRVGERLLAQARQTGSEGRQRTVRCTVLRGGEVVLEGDFTCHVPERHVLEAAAAPGAGGSGS